MTTTARTTSTEGSHWYAADGTPCYEVPTADGKAMRPTTLRDARKLGLLPSVTTILKILHKQALVDWLIEQSVLAVLTTPRLAGEADDAFVYRVLHGERVQDQEAQAARDRGTEIHNAMEMLFQGQPISDEMQPWVEAAFDAVCKRGELVATEKILVGDGYAGKTDLIQLGKDCWWLWDWKSAKKLPDPSKGGAWHEHRMQAGAYARAVELSQETAGDKHPIRTGNIYISTIIQGRFVICEHDDWHPAYDAFASLLRVWQYQTGYKP